MAAQKEKALLVFKDGTTKTGLAKLNQSDLVKFWANKNSKATKFYFSDLDQVKIYEDKKTSVYVYVKVVNKKDPMVLKLIELGKVSLYTSVTKGYAPIYVGGGSPSNAGGKFYNIKNLYVKREGDDAATHLGTNQLFSSDFRTAASEFFENCPVLVKKIRAKEYKKNDIKEIVTFYNQKCD